MSRRRTILCLVLVGIAPTELNGFYNSYLAQFPGWYWSVEIASWIILPAILLWIGMKNNWFTWSDLGLHCRIGGQRDPWLFAATIALLPWALMQSDQLFGSWAYDLFPVNFGAVGFHYRDMIPKDGMRRALALSFCCLSAGIVEEIYFRGMVRLLFRNTFWGRLGFVLASSLVFASVHWEGGVRALTEAFLFGVLAAVVYLLGGNLWPLILGHAWTDYIWFS